MGAVQILYALDGAVDRGELRAQGLRPARLRARRGGRRRAAVRRADRARGRDAARDRAALPGDRGGDGADRDGHGLRVRGHDVPAALEARRRSAPARASRSSRRRPSQQLEEDGIPPSAWSSSGSPTARYLGQGYELRVDVAVGRRSTTAWVGEGARGLPRHPRAGVHAPLRGLRHRDPEHPRARHRADAAARDAGDRGGRRIARRGAAPRGRGVVPGRRQRSSRSRRATTIAPRSRPATGSRARRSSTSTTRRP